jgi:acylphosphatase
MCSKTNALGVKKIKRATIVIDGTVQGVGFRYTTKDMAKDLGLFGFIRNEKNGTVYIEVEGEENKIEVFLVWCRNGPEWSEVKDVKFDFHDELKNYTEFKIGE